MRKFREQVTPVEHRARVRSGGVVALGALACIGAAACDMDVKDRRDTKHDDITRDVGRDTAAKSGMNAAAVSSIASARCEREQRCDNFGEGRKYADAAECRTKLTADVQDDLSGKDCPGGINDKELQECLSEIRSEDCNNPIDKLEVVAACRESDLCKATPRM